MQMISTEVCFLVSIHLAGQLSFSHLRHVSRQVFWCLIGQLRCPPLLSPRPVWRNSSLGESKHISQRSLMLERKEVLDDFCFCLDLGQCLPFTAGMRTGWFQMCFGRLIYKVMLTQPHTGYMQTGVRKENTVEPEYLSEKSRSNCSSKQLFPHLHLQRPPNPFTLSPE